MEAAFLSQHPVDATIRQLVRTNREAAPDEKAAILDRMATAPFDTRTIRVPTEERGVSYLGRTLVARDDPLFVHLVRRVMLDGQWAVGTSAAEYLADVRRAVTFAATELAVYRRRGGIVATTLTPTSRVVPAKRLGPDALPHLLVVYSADRGIIVSGYQVSDLATTSIPEDARWFK